SGVFDPATVHDPNAWQPLRYRDGSGAVVTPGFVGAQWQHVKPFGLTSSGMLRSPTGPARYGSAQYLTQAQQLLALSAGLTDEQKMIAEYWADGPRSELPPGHWNLFAQLVARRDRHGDEEHGIDLDGQLFFALTNAAFGASVTLPAGSSRVEPGAVPARDLSLSWSTFSEAADQAGISRRYGGIHFEQGDLDARTTGRDAARNAWQKALTYFKGTAS